MPLYQSPDQRIVLNVKRDFGAKGDTKTVTDGAMTSASPTLTSATAAFTAADVGKQVSVMSASSTSMRYSGRIVTITDATHVIVSPAPTLTTSAQTLVVDQQRSVADGVTTANSTTISSATAAFTSADVGKQITVTTAAATALNTTISGFTNSTTVTLAANATRTCSAVQVVYGTNDTTAIQNALNYAAIGTNVFTTVYLPEGTYLTAQSVSGAGGLIIYSNTSIRGDGWSTIIRAIGGASSVASGILEINPWDAGTSDPTQNIRNVLIADLHFQGTTQEDGFLQSMECITMAAATDVTIRNCKFSNMRSDGIYIGNGTHVATGERHNQRIKVLDCVFDGVNWENRNAISVLDCDDFLCDGCSFWYCSRSNMPGAIDFEPNIQAANPIVRGLIVSNNHFWYCGGNSGHVGIALSKSQLQYTTPPRGLQIIGNSFYHGAGNQMGIFLIQTQYPQESSTRNDVVISDNHFFGGGGYCAEIDGIKGVDIHDNIFEDFGSGIILGYQYKSLDIFCHDNVFKDCGLVGGNFFEITNCDRLEFNHNLLDNIGITGGAQGIVVGFKNGGVANQPTSIVATPSTTGGTLGAATRSYRLSTTKDGPSETLATTAVTAVTTGTTASVVLTWVPDLVGNGTKVYGRTGGSELLMATLGPEVGTFTDTGSVTPSGALPGADTTAHGSSNGVRFTNNIVQQGAGGSNITKIALLTANHNTVYANLLYRDNITPTGTPSTAITPFTETTLPYKASARAASTANISIPPGGTTLTVDGVTMVNGDRLLLKDQSTPSQNGVYVVGGIGTSVILNRSIDANVPGTVYDLKIGVGEGTLNAGTEWNQQTPQPITVDTTALRFTREWPPYQSAMRHPWDVGSTPPLIANMRRQDATTSLVLPTSATTLLSGGFVLPAGITFSNINMFVTAAGATLTIHWLAIVRQSDRLVLAHTANSTTTPTISTILTRAVTTPLVTQADTPVWIAHAFAATTGSGFAGTPAGQAVLNFQTPILFGNSSTTPTTTVPTDNSTVLGAPAAGTTQGILYWLT